MVIRNGYFQHVVNQVNPFIATAPSSALVSRRLFIANLHLKRCCVKTVFIIFQTGGAHIEDYSEYGEVPPELQHMTIEGQAQNHTQGWRGRGFNRGFQRGRGRGRGGRGRGFQFQPKPSSNALIVIQVRMGCRSKHNFLCR